jgi:CheY-like chemotaxis protein
MKRSHIIVVEDNQELRYALAKLLESAGYVVHQFPDYHGVTELLDSGCGDLLLVDIMLGKGTPHGISLAAMALVRRPDLPVIFVTGYTEYASYTPENANVLVKPVPDEVLLAAVKSSLHTR